MDRWMDDLSSHFQTRQHTATPWLDCLRLQSGEGCHELLIYQNYSVLTV